MVGAYPCGRPAWRSCHIGRVHPVALWERRAILPPTPQDLDSPLQNLSRRNGFRLRTPFHYLQYLILEFAHAP